MTTHDQHPTTITIPWTGAERAQLDALLDEILPATPDGVFPAASTLPVVDYLAARMVDTTGVAPAIEGLLRALSELLAARGVAALVDVPLDDRRAVVEQLERAQPDALQTFVRQVQMAYYTQPSIPPKLGLPDRPPQPLGHAVPRDSKDTLLALLAPVIARGKHYRDAG